MSALGQKRTWHQVRIMSALPPKADIAERRRQAVEQGPALRGRPLFHFGSIARVASFRLPPQLAGSVSAHVGCPPLLLALVGSLRLRRQLKHRRPLSLGQQRQEYDLPIRKLQCVVMSGNPLLVDLSKDCRGVVHHFTAPRE